MKKDLFHLFRIFGTLFVFTIILSACSSTYHTRNINDDDVYYSTNDDAFETSDDFEKYDTYNNDNKEEENEQQQKARRNEINRTILSNIAYVMLEGLYFFLIFH